MCERESILKNIPDGEEHIKRQEDQKVENVENMSISNSNYLESRLSKENSGSQI